MTTDTAQTMTSHGFGRRHVGDNTWITSRRRPDVAISGSEFVFVALKTEDAVGEAMFAELTEYAAAKDGDIVFVLLGGRGAQAMYRMIRERAEAGEIDELLARLHVFTQDALAPMRMDNGLSFVRDFERLLGPVFFEKVKSFTPMSTDTGDLVGSLTDYVERIESLGGIDLLFLGLGPEAEAASHICYLKPGCGMQLTDLAGVIPISPSILEHHISKFKAGGSDISAADETECRNATSILTMGPALILGAKRIVQSIVDASTAPAKRPSFRRLIETDMTAGRDVTEMINENPGLLVRLHSDVRCYVLDDLLTDDNV